MHSLKIAIAASLLLLFQGHAVLAQPNLPPGYVQETEQKFATLQGEMMRLKSSIRSAAAGVGLIPFLFGAFCALWAQNSNRSAWLWFFLGLILNIPAVLILLIKNSHDRKRINSRQSFAERRGAAAT